MNDNIKHRIKRSLYYDINFDIKTKVNQLKFSFIDFIIADVFLISVGKPSYSNHILKIDVISDYVAYNVTCILSLLL